MNKLKLLASIMCLACIGTATSQSKLQQKLQDKISKKKSTGKSKIYDYSDESGISGTYYTNEQIIDRQNTIGFKFTKERDGKIINQLYVELGGKGYGNRKNSVTCSLKEKYQTKHGLNYFYLIKHDCPGLANNSNSFVFLEIEKDVYTFTENEKVLSVAAKDKSKLESFDIETAQVLFDQKMIKIKLEEMNKETEKWKKNKVYANNVGKIVFSKSDYLLMKRGYTNKPPLVSEKGFETNIELVDTFNNANVYYMAFFEYPPAKQFPGQEINLEYEMNGIKTNRIELRSKSQAWNNAIKRIETKDYEYRQHAPRSLRQYSKHHKQFVQDYAFVYLMYQNKELFKVGAKIPLKVKMYVNRDGENGALLAEGIVNIVIRPEAITSLEGDPVKGTAGLWAQFEDFLDE